MAEELADEKPADGSYGALWTLLLCLLALIAGSVWSHYFGGKKEVSSFYTVKVQRECGNVMDASAAKEAWQKDHEGRLVALKFSYSMESPCIREIRIEAIPATAVPVFGSPVQGQVLQSAKPMD